ncbi:hypothetical protein [Terriglobus aquaticus]|uniref:Uncharacterized protein n=1 Tax=Terriglobus aquaticus TaxID=940139 RepID=A0ABW9KJZ4_9BACT
MASRPATAESGVEVVDAHLLTELEQRALSANAREQAFLYADLADKMSVLAGKQLADGEVEEAEATLERMEACTAKMENNLQQSKSLKKTELLLHMTHRRLSDMVRAAGMDAKPHVQSALKRLDAAQTALLAMIFSK